MTKILPCIRQMVEDNVMGAAVGLLLTLAAAPLIAAPLVYGNLPAFEEVVVSP
jgi:hypothetical protein